MKRGIVFGVLIVGIIISSFFMFFSTTSFVVHPIDKITLNALTEKAEVGCLQNSQCAETSECINNICVAQEKINVCQTISLSTSAKHLKKGDSIDSARMSLSATELPDLLADGKLFEVINEKIIEYPYSPSIFLGDAKIDNKDNNYFIQENNLVYAYRIFFFRSVDFSNKNIHGQTLRILGEEYIVGDNSDNAKIYLISEKRNVKLEENENIKIKKDNKGNVAMIEILYFSSENINLGTDFTDSIFDSIKLSFDFADDNFADINVGGSCYDGIFKNNVS